MYTSVRFLCAALVLSGRSGLHAATYYVAASGSDSNSGLSRQEAWKTIERINGTKFSAGDVILFHAGDNWNG